MRRASCFILLFPLALAARANATQVTQRQARRAPTVIPLLTPWLGAHGRPGPTAWRHAAHLFISYEIDPEHNTPAPVSTQADVGYTEAALWIRFVAQDPNPNNITARYRIHDDISGSSDDYVGVFFSPFNDAQWAYEFFCTAGGVEYDAFRQQNNEYSSFDAVWGCRAKRTSTGYDVVIRIPFKSIKFPHSDKPQIWRLMLLRNWPRNLRHQLSNRRMNYNSNCTLCQMQVVRTATPIRASPGNIQLIPAITALRTDLHNRASGGLDHGASHVEGSLDARWVLRPNLEWAATLNPNFSQVAPDVLQLSVNKQFALFYSENRPFFEQGTQVFKTPGLRQGTDVFSASGQLVDTRQIVDPHWATKVVGQVGPNVLGVLVADDSSTNILLPGPQSSSILPFDFASRDLLLRYRYDAGKSAFGLLATGRFGSGYRNNVYALDANWRLDSSDTLTALLGSSTTTYPEQVATAFRIPARNIAGQAWTATFSRSRRAYNVELSATHVTSNFRADLGYVPQVGYDEAALSGEYDFYGPDQSWYQNGGFGGLGHWTRTAGGGTVLDRSIKLYAFVHSRYQTHFIVFASQDDQYYADKIFPLKQYELDASAQPTNWLNASIDVIGGDGVDYVDARKGGLLSLSTSLGVAAGKHLDVSLVSDFERFNVAGGRLYTANLYDLRIAWYFNTHLFFRVIGQQQDVRNNTFLYPTGTVRNVRNLATQLLVGYQVNPWTAFYGGIANGYLGTGQGGLMHQQRKYFLKASYYFQP